MFLIVLLVAGAIAPIVLAAIIVHFGTRNVPRQGGLGMVIAMSKGLIYGALGGLLVCAVVIGLVLLLREAR